MDEGAIPEGARQTPIVAEADVVVAGAGLAGCAAAIAAARSGASTSLVDRNNAPGGNATFGMIGGITNLFLTPEGKQVMGGIPAEIVECLASATGTDWDWSATRGVPWLCFDNEIMKLVLDRMLEDAGVVCLFSTFVADAIRKNEAMQGIVVENKSGRGAVLGKCVVDCTGDGDTAAHGGTPFSRYEKTGASLLFRLGNIDLHKTVSFLKAHPHQLHSDPVHARERLTMIENSMRLGMFSLYDNDGETLQPLVEEAIGKGDFSLEAFGWPRLNRMGMEGLVRSGIVQINTGKLGVDTLNAQEICAGEISGRKMAPFVTAFLRKHLPGFENAWIVGTAGNFGVRIGRKIHAEYEYQLSDMGEERRFDDSVARACLGVMSIGGGYDADTSWSSKVMEVPYRCLVPRAVDNLLVGSGRSFPLEHRCVVRETPLCMALGQAAGTAAALAARSACAPRELDVEMLRRSLTSQRVRL